MKYRNLTINQETMKAEELEELKAEVKRIYIEEIGEDAYYKLIAEKLKVLVPLKQKGDSIFTMLSVEERKAEFEKVVMEKEVFIYEDEDEQIFQFGFWKIVLDTFEF